MLELPKVFRSPEAVYGVFQLFRNACMCMSKDDSFQSVLFIEVFLVNML